jgi:DNA-binding MarR family transcriptional regulator
MISRFEQFSASVACIYHCIQKIERVEMAKYGLKGPHAQCLLAMSRHPDGITASRLCAICDKDKAAISRTVAELEREGLVTRCLKGSNRYRALLKLTALGESAASHVEERVKLAVEKAGEGMSEQQRVAFYAVLELIAGRLQTICAEGLENV